MPKLWNETVEAHRRDVHEALLNTTAALVAEQGLRSVTMSQIAEETGIGRATLYKYFPDIESILIAWHERQITGHLQLLVEVGDKAGTPAERLQAVLETYAFISQNHQDTELGALLHRGDHMVHAQQHLREYIRELLADGAKTGAIRKDVAPDELATFCLHAISAASDLTSKAAVHRLVKIILAGVRTAEV
jgi:AcrR family transcriptional regulator